MTRKEAIKWTAYVQQSEPWQDRVVEALDMAIEALQTPPISQRSMYQKGYEQGREEALKQITGKLKNPDNSLFTADSEANKEQKSKLDLISRAEAIEAVTGALDAIDHVPKWVFDKLTSAIVILPSADRPKGEWTTAEVAELLANIFGDECACNWSGNDEWLPEVCKYAETNCPSPKEANGCWKQFLIQGGAGWVRR